MEARERRRDEQRTGGEPVDGPTPDSLDELRAAGEAFLAAGDAAIRRALSGDSEAFLHATRQRGGE
jgi:hypothetical protein